MKRFGWILMFAMAAAPGWSASKKITAEELKAMLAAAQQDKKTDEALATELKQVEMSEQLTPATLNALASYVPGAQTLAQVYILEARGAMLPPPASDLPTTPPLDPAAQKALLDKAVDYVNKTYAQLPDVTATKTTIRFQDSMDTVASSSGMHSSASELDTSSGLGASAQYYRFVNTANTPSESVHGVEKMSGEKDKTPWGANGMIALQEPGPILTNLIQEAETAEKISWLRWELVNGKPAAVFSFSVDKKKSHYAVNFCCFPDTEQAGTLSYSMKPGGGGSAPSSTNATAKGNLQTNTDWKNYKATVPYHGELFINAETGIVVRVVSRADFKSSDVVHQEDTRIDYDPTTIGNQTLVLPTKEFVNTEVVPKGEDSSGKYSVRHTLFYTEYKNYALAGAGH
jgi:hypothetical protein